MQNVRPFLLMLLALAGLLLVRCNNANDVKPIPQNGGNAKAGAKIIGGGPYDVTFDGVSNNGLTWTYTIQRVGPEQGNGLSHWIIGLGKCVSFSNVVSATIDGKPFTSLQSSEGNGTGCTGAVGANILKFDGLPSGLSDGQPHTFSFTLDVVVDVNPNTPTWVKPGNACYEGTIQGPGCFSAKGEVIIKDCREEFPLVCAGVEMTLTDLNGSAVKDADGNTVAPVTGCTFGFLNLLPAKYLITITKPTDPDYVITPAKTQQVDLTTGSKTGIYFNVTYDKCDETPGTGGCTYTQGYWKTHGPQPTGKNAYAWPAAVKNNGLKLGSVAYTPQQLLSIFKTPVSGNGLISLAHQLIAAKLNVAKNKALGYDAPAAVATAITQADALIGNLVIPPVGKGTLKTSATAALVGTLTQFNEGKVAGVPHCDAL